MAVNDKNAKINGVDGKTRESLPTESNQSGVRGFALNLGGHAKANHGDTSSFDADPLSQRKISKAMATENVMQDKEKDDCTSSAGRILHTEIN